MERVHGNCYFPDGSIDSQSPLNGCDSHPSTSNETMCCTGFSCQDNGLCDYAGLDHFIRGSCTDPSWKSDGCLKLCITGQFVVEQSTVVVDQDQYVWQLNSTFATVEACADGSFCCSRLNTTCCADKDGVWIDPSNFELKKFNPTPKAIRPSSQRPTFTSRSSSFAPQISNSSLMGPLSTVSLATSSSLDSGLVGQLSSPTSLTGSGSTSTEQKIIGSSDSSSTTRKASTPSTSTIASIILGCVIGLCGCIGVFIYIRRTRKATVRTGQGNSKKALRSTFMRSWRKPEKDGAELHEMDSQSKHLELGDQSLVEKPASEPAAAEIDGQEIRAELSGTKDCGASIRLLHVS